MPTTKPLYYIRTQIGGRWFCLYNIKYHPTRAVWFDELTLGIRVPKLYKTLAIARNTLDTYASVIAQSEVAVWEGSNGQFQTTGH